MLFRSFDTHSSDGRLYGYSPETLDHIIGWEGFANAMISVGWLDTDGPEALILPEFDEHNGKSGKRRAEDQKRKREDRKSPQSVRNLSSEITDEKLTREEKRREEVLNPLVPSVADDIPRPGKPECPHQEIIKIYHEVLPQCPTVRDWTPARATQLRARWNESPDRQNLDYWRGLFQYVAGCDFLVGRTSKPFFADLEFITKSNNFTKIREGKYENR